MSFIRRALHRRRQSSKALIAVFACAIAAAGCGPALATPASVQPTAATSVAAQPTPISSTSPAPTPAPTATGILPGAPLIVFDWYLPGKTTKDIFVAHADGSDAQPIATGISGAHSAPTWSPDGQRIAFVVTNEQTPNGSIWTVAPDGTGAALLYDGKDSCAGLAYPAWSHDGQQMLLVCYASDTDSRIAVLDIKAKHLTTLTKVLWPGFIDNPPRWSRDDTSIVFDILNWDPTNAFLTGSLIATVPAAGGPQHRLTSLAGLAAHPDWSPTQDLIVFSTNDLGNNHDSALPSNLYLIKPDGSGLRKLTSLSTNGRLRISLPRWSPDGTQILAGEALATDPTGNVIKEVDPVSVDPTTGVVRPLAAGLIGANVELRPQP